MKHTIITLLTILITSIASAQTVIITSPDLAIADKQILAKELQIHLMSRLKSGELVTLVDGSSQPKVIAEFYFDPRKKSMNHPRERARAWATQFKAVQVYLSKKTQNPEARIDLPKTIQFLASQYIGRVKSIQSIIVYANPLYSNPAEPAFNFDGMRVASDMHLTSGLQESVFGLKGFNTKLLKGTRGFWVYPSRFTWNDSSNLHQHFVERFWWLYVKTAGADGFYSFSRDLKTTLSNSSLKKLNMAISYTLKVKEGEPLQIIELRKRETIKKQMQLPTKELEKKQPKSTHSMSPVGTLKIAIRWNSKTDIDLFCSSSSKEKPLYYGRVKSKSGFFYKDHQTSPKSAFEFIQFTSPIDLRQLKASVNFFSGHANNGVGGEVLLFFSPENEDKEYVFVSPFYIKATKGNGGEKYEQRFNDPHWMSLDVMKIAKLKR